MTDPKTYFAVVCAAENLTLGYIVDVHPEQRAHDLARFAADGELVLGEFATLREARMALALGMARPVGAMQ